MLVSVWRRLLIVRTTACSVLLRLCLRALLWRDTMGNSASASAYAIDEGEAGPVPTDAAVLGRAARLYKYEAESSKWTVHRSLCEASFVDAAEEGDDDDTPAAWHLEARHHSALPARGGHSQRGLGHFTAGHVSSTAALRHALRYASAPRLASSCAEVAAAAGC